MGAPPANLLHVNVPRCDANIIVDTSQSEGLGRMIMQASYYFLLTTHCSLLTTHCSLLTAHCSLLTAHYSLLTAHCSLLTAHHALLTTHCPTTGDDRGRRLGGDCGLRGHPSWLTVVAAAGPCPRWSSLGGGSCSAPAKSVQGLSGRLALPCPPGHRAWAMQARGSIGIGEVATITAGGSRPANPAPFLLTYLLLATCYLRN